MLANYKMLNHTAKEIDEAVVSEKTHVNDKTTHITATERKAWNDNILKAESLQSQINNFVELPEGSTTGDAELINIRIGADGKEYDTAGEAVRAQATNANNKIDVIHEFINSFSSPVESQMWFNQGVISETGEVVGTANRKLDRWGYSIKAGTFFIMNKSNFKFKIFSGDSYINGTIPNCEAITDWTNFCYIERDIEKAFFTIKEINDNDISDIDVTDFITYVYLPSMGVNSSIEHLKLFQGGILFENGTITESTNRVRTNPFRAESDIMIEVLPPFEMSAFKYNLGDFEQRVNSTWCNKIKLSAGSISNYRLTFRNKYSDTIIPEEVIQKLSISNAATGVKYRNETENIVESFPLIYEFSRFSTDYSTEIDTPKVYNMNSDEFLDTFYNKYLGFNDGIFVGKRVLGKDESNTYDIWEYEFKPENYKKTILLSSGMHTYELPAMFGVARWIENYMTSTDDVFKWLRENVRVVIIPVVNPWGFNQSPKTYGNVNGVNPNRNFNDWNNAWENFPVLTPEENEWNVKGEEPFSEAETSTLKEWLENHKDAEFWIDNHTGLGCTRAMRGDVWCLYTSSNPNVEKIEFAINELQKHISEKYNVTATKYIQVDDETFIKGKFGTNVMGVPTMTIEQANGLDTSYVTVPNNTASAICEYATQLHAYILAQLY